MKESMAWTLSYVAMSEGFVFVPSSCSYSGYKGASIREPVRTRDLEAGALDPLGCSDGVPEKTGVAS
jgi:hypothetical protein